MVDSIRLDDVGAAGGAERHERADAAANRALILQAAERLFAERGVAEVCMAEIAEAAGVGKGTLYRRFANKAELCLALMDRQLTDFQEEALAGFRRQTEAGVPFIAQLGDFLTDLVGFTEIHSPLLKEVESGGLLQSDTRYDLPHFWQYMTVRGLLQSAARRGELAPDLDLDFLAETLLAPLQVDFFRFQRDVRGFSPERISSGLRALVESLAAPAAAS